MGQNSFAGAISVLALTVAFSLAPSIARADDLDRIKQNKQITIATEARYQPFEYVADGKIIGYDADLLKLIMDKLPNVRVNQLDLPFQGILPGLAAKKFDFVVTAVTMTRARTENYAFTAPVAEATVAFLKRQQDSTILKPEDIVGKVVGSQAGSGQLQALQEFSAKLAREGGKGAAEIREYVDFNEAYADLAAGRLQAVAQSIPNLAPLVKERGDTFAIVEPPFGPKTYFGWVGRKDADSASLVKFFSDGIAELNRSGKMKELQQKWFGFVMGVPADQVPEPAM